MKRFPYVALLVLIFAMLACVVPGVSPEATATATILPSDTPSPTDTAMPTDTATPLPTATPDVAATSAARATQSAGDVLGELDKLLDDTDIPYKEGHLAWQQAKPLNIKLTGPDNQVLEIGDEITAGNFIFKSDVTWEASGLILCGAVFRSEPNLEEGKQYQFLYLRLSGLPAWGVEVHEFGHFKNSLTKSKYSDALDLGNGATNQFVIVAQDEQFTVYINNVRQGKYYDYSKQRMEGSFGFLGLQDSGKGNCEYENSWVWELK